MIRFLASVLVLMMAACTLPVPITTPPSSRPFVPGTPAPEFYVGMNDGIGGPLPPSVVDTYCALGKPVLIRTPFRSIDGGIASYSAIAGCPTISLLFLIEDNDLSLVRTMAEWVQDGRELPQVKGFENGNELDLATATRRDLSPEEFATFTVSARDIERMAGWRGWILTGGIYEVNDGHLTYLRNAIDACGDCIAALHWYGDDSDPVMQDVQDLHRLTAVTETGIPSCNKKRTPVVQAAFTQERLARLPLVGNMLAVILYQRLSGPSSSDLDCFGIENKPSWDIFTTAVRTLSR